MKTLIVTDIHANAVALEAVLATPEAQACGRIISLGDQINYGPEPRRVLELLNAFAAQGRELTVLMGNHEERLTRMDDPDLQAGYNWSLLRWTARQVPDIKLDLPLDLREGSVWYTHGTPGNPYHLVDDETIKPVLEALPEGVEWLISGHDHMSRYVEHRGRKGFNPGSVGMLEDGEGCLAAFAVIENDGSGVRVQRHIVPYDGDRLRRAAADSGYWREAPEMARMTLWVMTNGKRHGALEWMSRVRETADRMGRAFGDIEVWSAADRAWPWQEPMDSETYWKRMTK